MLRVVTPPILWPVTLEEAVDHLNLDAGEKDRLVDLYIRAATRHVENWTGLALMDQTIDYFVDDFPDGAIYLPRPPLIEVLSVAYGDGGVFGAGTEVSDYFTDIASFPGRVYTATGVDWPTSEEYPNAVRIRYRAGYVETDVDIPEGQVPEDIKSAILLTIGTMFAHRETVVVGEVPAAMPLSAEYLLRMYRVETSLR
jgi:uncharacterized phiE125 gp8 family phage protein